MPIPVDCGCGKSMLVKDEWAGKRARCPECKQPLVVPSPKRHLAEDEIIEAEPVEPERPSRFTAKPRPGRPRAEDDDEEVIDAVAAEKPQRPKLQRDEDDEDDEDDRPRRRRDEDDRRERRRPKPTGRARSRPSSNGLQTSAWGGLGLMLLAVIWFVGGLFVGYIFFYPPILFVVGLIAFVKGLVSR